MLRSSRGLKIRTKFTIIFAITALLILGVSLYSLLLFNQLKAPLVSGIPQEVDNIKSTSSQDNLAQLIRFYDEVLTQSARNYAFTGDSKWKERYDNYVPPLDKAIKDAIQKGDTQDKQLFASVDAANLALIDLETAAITAVDARDRPKAIQILESAEYAGHKETYKQALEQYVARRGTKFEEGLQAATTKLDTIAAAAKQSVATSIITLSIVSALGILLAIVAWLLMQKLILRPILALSQGVALIRKGQLDAKVDVVYRDEIGEVGIAFNQMSSRLKEAHLELSEEKARLLASIQSLALGFIMLDDQNQVIIKNEAVGQVLGYGERDWTVHDLAIDLDGAVDVLAVCAQVRSKGQLIGFGEVNFGPKILRMSFNPVFVGKTVIGVAVLVEDITETKVLERSRDEFFSIASHELRTPLTAIKGNASMALSYYQDQLKDPGLHEMVDDIHTSSLRLIEIVNDFLDTSRLEQGKIQFKMQQCSLDAIIEQVTYEMGAVLQQKGLYLKVSDEVKTLGSLPQVFADPDRAKQIIYNLVGNAAKFTEKGGITLDIRLQGNFIKVRVSDTGRGIPVEGQKLLFHKFQQAGSSLLTRDTTRGTGLGLYISKLLVQGMGGEIGLEDSVADKGSTFFFTLPIEPDKAASPTGTVPAPIVVSKSDRFQSGAKGRTSKRILIFEDDPYVQRLYQRLFAFENYEIELVGDGGDGMNKVKAFKPGLVLLDIMMPKANGLEVLRSLKSDEETKAIPVLMLTNLGEGETIKQAMDLGVSGYLIKADFTPERMLAEVKKYISP